MSLRRPAAARVTSTELLAALRDNVAHPWKPPGGGALGALSHDVIHGLDVTVGLGLGRLVPRDRIAMVLAGLTPRNIAFFGAALTGIALQATEREGIEAETNRRAGRPYATSAPQSGLGGCPA